MEKFITDQRTGLQYELVGGLLSDCRRADQSGYGKSGICGI